MSALQAASLVQKAQDLHQQKSPRTMRLAQSRESLQQLQQLNEKNPTRLIQRYSATRHHRLLRPTT